ncbi:MAG: hypothetical protein Q9M17_00710 [Mariprofundus sp.]|nr:hypothetical protein [Mariprofundus sp.]
MSNNFSSNIESLLKKLYRQSHASGLEDEKQQDFIRGYMAAGLQSALIDKATLEGIIDSAHHDVFGMSISEKHYEKMIRGESTTFYDTPTLIRNGVKLNQAK